MLIALLASEECSFSTGRRSISRTAERTVGLARRDLLRLLPGSAHDRLRKMVSEETAAYRHV
jgi:hypothetical protein